MKIDLSTKICEAVASYRLNFQSSQTAVTPETRRAFEFMVYRAQGKIDLLYELDPKSPAWRQTGWTV